MRVAPLGLVLAAAPLSTLVEAVVDSCTPTHRHPESAAAAAAIAAGVAYCARAPQGTLHPPDFVAAASAGASAVPGGARVAAAVAAVDGWCSLTLGEARALCSALDPRSAPTPGGVSGDAAASVAWAIYAFASNAESLPRTLFTAIRGGGDTDTTAAMAGALVGAYLGVEAVPLSWQAALHDAMAETNAASLTQLASSLYQLRWAQSGERSI